MAKARPAFVVSTPRLSQVPSIIFGQKTLFIYSVVANPFRRQGFHDLLTQSTHFRTASCSWAVSCMFRETRSGWQCSLLGSNQSSYMFQRSDTHNVVFSFPGISKKTPISQKGLRAFCQHGCCKIACVLISQILTSAGSLFLQSLDLPSPHACVTDIIYMEERTVLLEFIFQSMLLFTAI